MRSCLAFLVINLAACQSWSFCIWSLMMYRFGIGKSSDRSCAWHCFWALRTTFNAQTLLNKHSTSPTQRLFSIFYSKYWVIKTQILTNGSYIPQSLFQDPNGPVTVGSYVSTRSKGSPHDTAWILPQPHRLRLWVKWAMARPNLRWLMKHQRKKKR